MSIFDIDHIINATPQKRLINGYRKLKENYTKENAQEFLNVYKNEPLSFIFENSRSIFSEPYYGLDFYKESIENNAECNFTLLEKEYDKLQDFMEENNSSMSDTQKSKYSELLESVKTYLDNSTNTRILANYIKENIDDTFEEKLSNVLHEYKVNESIEEDNIISLFESVKNPMVFFTYIPYVMEMVDGASLYPVVNSVCEKSFINNNCNTEQWKSFVESVLAENKLSLDKNYKSAINNIHNRSVKCIFEYFINTSLNDKIDELIEEKVDTAVLYDFPVDAVNNIFYDMQESVIDVDSSQKERIDMFKSIVYEESMNLLMSEYQQCDNTSDIAKGYSILSESATIDDAFEKLGNLYSESVLYTESDEDISDDELESLQNDIKNDNDNTDGGHDTGKKPVAPKPKNLANKIQFKAMDKEAKWQQKQSIRKQKGQEIISAAKAVLAIPSKILGSIKNQIHQLDKADENRRKNYMTEPGFRKKAFRNLKVAILYGTAAHIKLAWVPTVAICRHFSKSKDRRIRNELSREIETEIRVCEEKISDANAAGDQKEKYRLMRIKDQLDAELVRVKMNSKYV